MPWSCMGEWMYRFLTSALFVSEWSASRPGRISRPRTHCIGGWVSPRAGLDTMEKWKFFTLPGLERRQIGVYVRVRIGSRIFTSPFTSGSDEASLYSHIFFFIMGFNIIISSRAMLSKQSLPFGFSYHNLLLIFISLTRAIWLSQPIHSPFCHLAISWWRAREPIMTRPCIVKFLKSPFTYSSGPTILLRPHSWRVIYPAKWNHAGGGRGGCRQDTAYAAVSSLDW
jgi:hypothetical protein